MASRNELGSPPRVNNPAIARSRSRYRGNRPAKTLSSPPLPSSINYDLSHGLRDDIVEGPKRKANMTLRGRMDEGALEAKETCQSPTLINARKTSRPRSYAAPSNPTRTYLEPSQVPSEHNLSSMHEVDAGSEHLPQQALAGPGYLRRTAKLDHTHGQQTGIAPEHQPTKANGQLTTGKSSALAKETFTQRMTGSNSKAYHSKREELKRTISAPIVIELSPSNDTSDTTPAFDAPVSAVNAGERKVNVKYDQSVISLRVTPSTTPTDIICSAARSLSKPLNTTRTVLLESFKQLGLERPLRQYEHVRDVLNSWDNDTENTLVIVPSPTDGRDDDLDLNLVSTSQPEETIVHLYHSQRPGHWDKRWITLRSDGQVLVAKKDNGETINICHLSDFDIYIPTARQLAKRTRPPKKLCFAVKSQQKSSIFLSTANFVHFFSTSDKTAAASFYKAVQEWRSWYLVNVMGEGLKESKSAMSTVNGAQNTTVKNTSHKLKRQGESAAEPNPQPQPLSVGKSERPNTVPRRFISDPEASPNAPFQSTTDCTRRLPPVSYSNKFTTVGDLSAPATCKADPSLSLSTSTAHSEPQPFATTGLLGRTYSKRQQAQQEREKQDAARPPKASTGTVNSPHDDLNQTLSQRLKTKPLIDLTPQYQEPPQHARKGRGVKPERIPAGGLVEVATSPEEAISIPPTTSWRRPTTSAEAGIHGQRSRTIRLYRGIGPSSKSKQTSASAEMENPEPTDFRATNEINDHGMQGIVGAARSDRQMQGPLLNLEEGSRYAPGSLLAQIKRHDGGSRPVLER